MQYPSVCAPRAARAVVVLAVAVLSACDAADAAFAPGERAAYATTAATKVARIALQQTAVVKPSYTVPAGVPFRVVARLYDAGGREVTGRQVRWSTAAPAVATVDTLGVVTPRAVGQTMLVAGVDGAIARLAFAVAAPVAKADSALMPRTAPGATTVATATAVPLVVRRFDGQSGAVTVSNGVPLRPGALRAGQEGQVRLTVAGQERRIYAKVLEGTHADGSARSLLVQFDATLGAGETLTAQLAIGATRAAAFTAATPLVAPNALPAAAALPSDPAYLVATDLVGKTLTAAQTAALGGAFADYDRAFRPAADKHWATYGDAWEHNYYDRSLIYAEMWARTGEPEYWRRSLRQAVAYRRGYLEPNNYGSSPHWSQLEGIEKHYLLTGEEASRTAVSRTADMLWAQVYRTPLTDWDQRIAGRVLLGQLLAYRLNGTARGEVMAPAGFAQRMDVALNQLTGWARADGSFNTGSYWCGGQANFMVGLLSDALIKAHTYYRADPRIVASVRRATDYLWATQWNAGAQAFQYMNLACPDRGDTNLAGDLNGLVVAPFSWLAVQTGDVAYRTRGDQVFAGLTRNAYLVGSKQFNEAYALSPAYLGWR